MTTTGYCYRPSCSRVGESEAGGLCLMHALESGAEIACGECSQPFRLIPFFPRIACAC